MDLIMDGMEFDKDIEDDELASELDEEDTLSLSVMMLLAVSQLIELSEWSRRGAVCLALNDLCMLLLYYIIIPVACEDLGMQLEIVACDVTTGCMLWLPSKK